MTKLSDEQLQSALNEAEAALDPGWNDWFVAELLREVLAARTMRKTITTYGKDEDDFLYFIGEYELEAYDRARKGGEETNGE